MKKYFYFFCFGILDLILLYRFIGYINLSPIRTIQEFGFNLATFIPLVNIIFLLSLIVSSIGLFLTQKWGIKLNSIQFPFRFLFLSFSFGFITNFNLIFQNQVVYYSLLVIAAVFEIARLTVTIRISKEFEFGFALSKLGSMMKRLRSYSQTNVD